MHVLLAVAAGEDGFLARLAAEVAAVLRAQTPAARVSSIDLGRAPTVGRVGALVGVGWMARDWVRTVAREAGEPVDAVVELDASGARHLLGLGRATARAVRVAPVLDARGRWLARLASREGAIVFAPEGAVGGVRRLPGDAKAAALEVVAALQPGAPPVAPRASA